MLAARLPFLGLVPPAMELGVGVAAQVGSTSPKEPYQRHRLRLCKVLAMEKGYPEVNDEDNYERAYEIARKSLSFAMKEGDELAPLVAFVMIESAVLVSTGIIPAEHVVKFIRDIADQLEGDHNGPN